MFGELDQLRLDAQERLESLHARGVNDAEIYDPMHTSVGGIHAFFLIRGKEKTYNLPPNPEVPTVYVKEGWKSAAIGSAALLAGAFFAFLGARR